MTSLGMGERKKGGINLSTPLDNRNHRILCSIQDERDKTERHTQERQKQARQQQQPPTPPADIRPPRPIGQACCCNTQKRQPASLHKPFVEPRQNKKRFASSHSPTPPSLSTFVYIKTTEAHFYLAPARDWRPSIGL